MKNILKYSPVVFLLLAPLPLLINYFYSLPEEILIPRYPITTYEDPDLLIRTPIILSPFVKYNIIHSNIILLQTKSFSYVENNQIIVPVSRISRYIKTFLVEYNGKELWCSENIIALYDNDLNQFIPTPFFERDDRFITLIFLILALLLFLFYKLIHIHSLINVCAFYFVLRIFAFTLFLYYNCYFITLVDSDQFFQIAREILDLNRHTIIPNQIGAALIFIPFIFFLKPDAYIDMANYFSIFNFLFVGGGILILSMLISHRITNSYKALHITGLLISIFPACAYIYYDQSLSMDKIAVGTTMISFKRLHPYSGSFYNIALLNSWNGHSDNIALFFIIIVIFLLIYLKTSYAKYSLMGFFIGLSLSTRYASIVAIAPIIILDMYKIIFEEKTKISKVVTNYGLFLIFSVVGFSPQLLDNYLIMGDPLKPVASENLYQGGSKVWHLFGVSNLFQGYKYYIIINYNMFVVSLLSLLAIKENKYSLFLWLWIILTLTFYSSSNFFNCHPVRYILSIYVATYLAIGISFKNTNIYTLIFYSLLCLLNLNLELNLFISKYFPANLSKVIIALLTFSFALLAYLYDSNLFKFKSLIYFTIFIVFLCLNDWRLIILGLFIFPIIMCSRICLNIFSTKQSLWRLGKYVGYANNNG